MSHAVAGVPILLSYSGMTAVASAAAVILIPVAIGMALGAIVSAMEKSCEEERKLCALRFKDDLATTVKSMESSLDSVQVSDSHRKALRQEYSRLTKLPEILANKIETSHISNSDVHQVKKELEQFNEKVALYQARFKENKQQIGFQEEIIRNYFKQIETKYAKDPGRISALKQEFADITDASDEHLDKKVSRMSDFSSKMAAMLDRLVLEKLLGGLVNKSEKAAPAPKGPQGPGPGPTPDQPDPLIKKLAKLKKAQQEIDFYFRRLKETAPEKVTGNLEKIASEAATSEFLDRILAIRDEIKMTYQKVHEALFLSDFFKEKLQASLTFFGPETGLHEKIRQALKETQITRDMFQPLYEEIETRLGERLEKQRRELIESKIREGLAKLDYVVMDSDIEENMAERLQKGEIVLTDTKYDDYKLLIRMGKNDALVIRLVRVVADEKEKTDISEFQRKKDKELMGEWCKNLDLLKEHLKQSGVLLVENLRVEENVDYFTIEQLELQKVNTTRIKKQGTAPAATRVRRKE